MTGRTHLTIGVAVGLAIAEYSGATPRDTVLLVLAAAVGSLLPDIDHRQSMLSGWIPGSGLVGLFVRHRGITHSILFCVIAAPLISFGLRSVTGAGLNPTTHGIALLLGGISHLAADMLTPAGVPLLLPLSGRSFKLAPGFALRILKWTELESVVWLGALAVIGIILVQGIDPAQIARMADFLASIFPIRHDSPLEI